MQESLAHFPSLSETWRRAPLDTPGQAPELASLIKPGRLHEALPAAPGDEAKGTAFLAGIARGLLQPGSLLLWIEEAQVSAEHGGVYAPGLAGFGLDPAGVILVQARRRVDALWAAEQGLQRKGVVVLLELGPRGRALDLTLTRRLALSAAASNATILALRGDIVSASRLPSAAWTRWQIARAPSRSAYPGELGDLALTATILRNRSGSAGSRYFLQWIPDEHIFRAQALGSDLAAPSAN